MPDSKAVAWLKNFWQLHQVSILALILSALTLPFSFSNYITTALDGSWQRALNIAVKNGARFGTEFVFTYGPLGFVATRNTQYVNNLYLVLADLFLFVGFFYIFRKYLLANKAWFFIFFVALLFYKGTDYSVSLFLVFLIFTIYNVKNNFSNYFEVIFCIVAGVLSFFIKVNYGIISFAFLLLLTGYLLFTDRKKYIIFVSIFLSAYFSIDYKVNVDFANYIGNILPAISGYEEAMLLPVIGSYSTLYSAILIFILFFVAVLFYLSKQKIREIGWQNYLYPAPAFALMYFLTYKNGFIRYDDGHTHTFFAVVPLLMSFSLFEFRMERTALAKILGVSALLICDYNYENIVNKKGLFANSTYAPVLTYFSGMSSKQIDSLPKELKLNKETISMLGRSTIDIIPIDVAIPQLNNLNYKPRPVTQSYAAYGFKLDSLNANHFFKEDRPEYVMISTWTIDDRYPSWDESLTKAVLRLNYEYVSHVSMNGDSLLTNAYNDYLLLKAKKGPGIYPIFEKLFDTVIGYGDVLNLNFPNNAAVYMKVKTEYSLAGKLKKLLYRPSIISYTQYLDEGGKESFSNRLIRPIGEGPVLVNKYIAHNSEFINFTTGCLHFNKDVKAIKFTAENKSDLNPRIHISFIKLANY